jgi:hypothetical protein
LVVDTKLENMCMKRCTVKREVKNLQAEPKELIRITKCQ